SGTHARLAKMNMSLRYRARQSGVRQSVGHRQASHRRLKLSRTGTVNRAGVANLFKAAQFRPECILIGIAENCGGVQADYGRQAGPPKKLRHREPPKSEFLSQSPHVAARA